MTKHYCDRCGVKMSNLKVASTVELKYWPFDEDEWEEILKWQGERKLRFDSCDRCLTEIKDFIKKKPEHIPGCTDDCKQCTGLENPDVVGKEACETKV